MVRSRENLLDLSRRVIDKNARHYIIVYRRQLRRLPPNNFSDEGQENGRLVEIDSSKRDKRRTRTSREYSRYLHDARTLIPFGLMNGDEASLVSKVGKKTHLHTKGYSFSSQNF